MAETITKADEAASFAVYATIETTLQHYINGALKGDSALMRKAFLVTAHIRGSYGAKQVDWPLSEFCGLIDKSGPASELSVRVMSVEHSGTAAMARLEAENWRGTGARLGLSLRRPPFCGCPARATRPTRESPSTA